MIAQAEQPPPQPEAPAFAPPQPLPPAPTDSRIQSVEYHADQVIPIQVAAGYQLMVEFAADEQIESVAVGDSSAWQVTPNHSGDRIFIKPLQSGLATNLTIVTSARTYTFELNPGSTDAPYVLRFTYPGAHETAEADPAGQVEGRYRLSGAHSLRPSRISDDGVHTYIEWPRDSSIPAVYAIDERGEESIVNGMMRDDLFVIDSVVHQLVFRIDRHVARAERVEQRGQP